MLCLLYFTISHAVDFFSSFIPVFRALILSSPASPFQGHYEANAQGRDVYDFDFDAPEEDPEPKPKTVRPRRVKKEWVERWSTRKGKKYWTNIDEDVKPVWTQPPEESIIQEESEATEPAGEEDEEEY